MPPQLQQMMGMVMPMMNQMTAGAAQGGAATGARPAVPAPDLGAMMQALGDMMARPEALQRPVDDEETPYPILAAITQCTSAVPIFQWFSVIQGQWGPLEVLQGAWRELLDEIIEGEHDREAFIEDLADELVRKILALQQEADVRLAEGTTTDDLGAALDPVMRDTARGFLALVEMEEPATPSNPTPFAKSLIFWFGSLMRRVSGVLEPRFAEGRTGTMELFKCGLLSLNMVAPQMEVFRPMLSNIYENILRRFLDVLADSDIDWQQALPSSQREEWSNIMAGDAARQRDQPASDGMSEAYNAGTPGKRRRTAEAPQGADVATQVSQRLRRAVEDCTGMHADDGAPAVRFLLRSTPSIRSRQDHTDHSIPSTNHHDILVTLPVDDTLSIFRFT